MFCSRAYIYTATAYLQSTLCKWSVSVSAEHAPPCVQQMQYLVQQGRANRDIGFLCRKKCRQIYLPSIYLHTLYNLHIRSQYNIKKLAQAVSTSSGSGWEQLGAAARSLLLCSKLYTTAALQHCSTAASCRQLPRKINDCNVPNFHTGEVERWRAELITCGQTSYNVVNKATSHQTLGCVPAISCLNNGIVFLSE